jgi:hypothetical protein
VAQPQRRRQKEGQKGAALRASYGPQTLGATPRVLLPANALTTPCRTQSFWNYYRVQMAYVMG